MDKDSNVIMEDDVVDIIGQKDISIGVDEVEIIDVGIAEEEDGAPISSLSRRRCRQTSKISTSSSFVVFFSSSGANSCRS